MRPILGRCFYLGGCALTGVLLLMALLFSISRAVLPVLTDYRQDIQAHLSELLGREVSIGKINARWHQTTPQIKLVDVSIYDASGSRPELTVDSIFFSLDVVDTIRSGAVRVKEIGVRGCEINILRNRDHAIVIHGLEPRIPQSWNTARIGSIESIVQSKINLIGCQVSWKDEISGKDYRFNGVNASVSSEDGHKRIAARLTPVGRLGMQLTVLMEFQGQLNRPSGWQGRLYVNAQDLQLESFLPDAMLREYGLKHGRLKLENWSDWRQGKPVRMVGSLSLSGARLLSSPFLTASEHDIDLVQAQYEWRGSTQGWRLRVGGLNTVIDGRSWPESGFSLDYRFDGNSDRQYRGAVDSVNLQQLPALFSPLPGLTQAFGRRWERLMPSGELSDVRFFLSLDEGRVEGYRLSARARDLGISSREGIPGIAGLDGWIYLSEKGGEAVVESRNVLLEYPQAFGNILSADYLSSVFTWSSEDGDLDIGSESLRIGNEDIEIEGGGRLVFGEGSPHIDVELSYGQGNGASLERYLPKKIMPRKVHQWLVGSIGDVAIRSGTAVIRGNASDFPFAAGEGVFEASALLEKGSLDYKTGWPKLDDIHANLLFRGQSMEITDARASVLDSRLSGVTIAIENLRQAELKMQAEVNGPLSDVWRYSSQTVLPKDDRRIVKDLKLVGKSRMVLDINLPLSDAIKNREKVAGELHLNEAALELEDLHVKLENITGKLGFGPHGTQGQGIRADLHGRPVMISARPNAPVGTLVEIQGRLGADDLVKNLTDDRLKKVLYRSITGSSDWLAQVSIPHGQLMNDNRIFRFRIWSDLQGTEVNAPEPFMKAADEQESFYMSAELGTDGSLPLQIRYGKRLSMALSMQKRNDEYSLVGGDIRLYRGEAVLPAEGVRVQGSLQKCSIGAWHIWLQQVADYKAGHGKRWSIGHMPTDVDIDFGLIEINGFSFEDVELSADKQRDSWHVKVESSAIKGVLEVPPAVTSDTPLRANLDYLKLPERSRKPGATITDPRQVPAFQIKGKVLRYGDWEFQGFYLDASPRQDGMSIRDMYLATETFSLRLNGYWVSPDEQANETKLKLVLKSDDFGAMMRQLNLGTGFESGSASVTANLRFPAAPYQWSYRGLAGNAHIVLQEGQLGEFEPGPWRVLGLMNINAFSRRLSLNFSDLLKKGFSYDNIEGILNIEESDVYTSDLRIKGPSADLAISGRMGLEARDYDQHVSVVSKVSTGVTVAGALLGGVGVGAAIFVADRIINSMGGGIDNVTRLNYKVSGTWDDPRIELMSPPTASDKYLGIIDDDIG